MKGLKRRARVSRVPFARRWLGVCNCKLSLFFFSLFLQFFFLFFSRNPSLRLDPKEGSQDPCPSCFRNKGKINSTEKLLQWLIISFNDFSTLFFCFVFFFFPQISNETKKRTGNLYDILKQNYLFVSLFNLRKWKLMEKNILPHEKFVGNVF